MFNAAMKEWTSTGQLLAQAPFAGTPGASVKPIYCLYPDVLRAQARQVMASLPRPFFAVKANTLPFVLDCLVEEQMRNFDIASLAELIAVRAADLTAVCAFMNPVKQKGDIAEAYRLGVRTFALDALDELDKILQATSGGSGCTLIVRMSLAPKRSLYDMTGKFGAPHEEAVLLLQRIAATTSAAGLTFHVGSQCEHPQSFGEAIEEAANVVAAAGVTLAVLDVGGGFPARYIGNEPALGLFGQTIEVSFEMWRHLFGVDCRVQSEPGRSLVATAGSVLVRVELRRGQNLFINEGLHGLLSELRWLPGRHPVRRLAADDGAETRDLAEFSFAGPTCDAGDFMKGPYVLPADMRAGDWVEIGCLGAYCIELVTPFNGFGGYDVALIQGSAPWHMNGIRGHVDDHNSA